MTAKMTVRFVPSTGAVEVDFTPNGISLKDVLGEAGFNLKGMALSVNGQPNDGKTPAKDGDKAVVAPKVAGA